MHLKYIIVVTEDGLEVPVIFSPLLQHEFVASALRTESVLRNDAEAATVVSAGFVTLYTATAYNSKVVTVYCDGESDSIGVKSRYQTDADIIQQTCNKQLH